MSTVPRTFKSLRVTDVSGVSGEGHVADGVVFEDGTTVLRWRTEHRSTAIYGSFEDMVTIHGHGGATRFAFDDEEDLAQEDLEEVMREHAAQALLKLMQSLAELRERFTRSAK